RLTSEGEKMRLLTVLMTVFVVASVTAASAASEPPRDLPVSYLFSGPGHMTKLASGATYQATELPIALRVTTPNGSWSGAQWKTGRLGCCGTINGVGDYGGPPFFGWAAFGQGGTNAKIAPQGFFEIGRASCRERVE